MVYITFEDVFFKTGFVEILNGLGVGVRVIKSEHLELFENCFSESDVVLICIQNAERCKKLANLFRASKARLLFFIDLNINKAELHIDNCFFMSKKSRWEQLKEIVIQPKKRNFSRTDKLSNRERVIMDLLAKDTDVSYVAEMLNMRKKTIYLHKSNALRKLGLEHLNSVSLLVYNNIF